MGVTTYIRIKYHSADQTSTLSAKIILTTKLKSGVVHTCIPSIGVFVGDRLSAEFRKN